MLKSITEIDRRRKMWVLVGAGVFTVSSVVLIAPFVSVYICVSFSAWHREIVAAGIDVTVALFWCIMLRRPVRQLRWIRKIEKEVEEVDRQSGEVI